MHWELVREVGLLEGVGTMLSAGHSGYVMPDTRHLAKEVKTADAVPLGLLGTRAGSLWEMAAGRKHFRVRLC